MKRRTIIFYQDHFHNFYYAQKVKVREKIAWTLGLIEELELIPEIYFKHLEGTKGLYEIRVQLGSDAFRIFCFFDHQKLVVLMNGFVEKSQKTPTKEIEKAERLKAAYHEEKTSRKKS